MGIELPVNSEAYGMLNRGDIPWFAEQLGYRRIDAFYRLAVAAYMNRKDMLDMDLDRKYLLRLALNILKEDEGVSNPAIPETTLYAEGELWVGDNHAVTILRDDNNLKWPYLQELHGESLEVVINRELTALGRPPRSNGFMGIQNALLYALTFGSSAVLNHAQSNIVARRLCEEMGYRIAW